MDHHDDRRDREPREGAEEAAPRERVTDRDWNAAGGDPDVSSVLGGTASHQRPSFNDPAAGNQDPIIGTSGLEAQEIAGTRSPITPAGGDAEWVENSTRQSRFEKPDTDAPRIGSDEAAERARRRDSEADTRES